jgi:ribosomal protein S12 methylthiotransferase accessory factor
LTGLDRVGIPVWQAIRPWSKSVSVHQGKGLTAEAAELGACLEAVECRDAEEWVGETRLVAFDALPITERLPAPDDCSQLRGAIEKGPIDWTPAERLGEAGRLWVPTAAVSLDTCRSRPNWILCSSDGQGTGFDREFAACKAILEVVERDTFTTWLFKSIVARALDGLAIHSIEFGWFQEIAERLAELNMRLRVFAPPAVIDVPVFVAEIVDPGSDSHLLAFVHGICAHEDAETALKGAITEAAQCRLTEISGARDDLRLDRPEISYPSTGLALSMPSTVKLLDFETRFPGRQAAKPAHTLGRVAAALSDAGYPVIGQVRLSPAEASVTTVKMFVPGLAAGDRARRPPI